MIILGADHAGFELKEKIKKYLELRQLEYVDVGAKCVDSNDDFSKFVLLMRNEFQKEPQSKIIAVCGSGVGMNIGLNKTNFVRCVLGHNRKEVETARKHNNVNAITFGGRVISFFKVKRMLDVFFKTPFLEGKYKTRMDEIEIN